MSRGALTNEFIGGSKGNARDMRPPLGTNSFNFMQVWGKISQIIAFHINVWSWRPLLGEILDPPLDFAKFSRNRMELKEFGPGGGTSKMLLCRSATGEGAFLTAQIQIS